MGKLFERVREARRLTGLSQEALAVELGVSRSAVAQWEMINGTSPSVDNLIALARSSGMAFEYLATGRGATRWGEPIRTIADEREDYQPLSDQQRRLLRWFESLSTRQRKGLLDLLGD